MMGRPEGIVWWITGLSGAGKTTVSRVVRDGLSLSGRTAVLLDGDAMRAVLGDTAAHGQDDRRRLAMTYARLARELAAQGIDVVCATISMFHEVRAWNRGNVRRYVEIYLRVPLSELERRDPCGLYTRARRGEAADVVGIDVPFEEPDAPDLVIDNFGAVTAEEAAVRILALVPR